MWPPTLRGTLKSPREMQILPKNMNGTRPTNESRGIHTLIATSSKTSQDTTIVILPTQATQGAARTALHKAHAEIGNDMTTRNLHKEHAETGNDVTTRKEGG